jgi:Ca-activated chloride channel family protein
VLLTLLRTGTLSGQGATIEVTPSATAPAGSTVTVKWSGPNGRGDYITVVPKGARPSDYRSYQLTSDGRTVANPVRLVLPAEPGPYEIRYVSGNPRSVRATVPYEVTAIAATVEGPVSVAPDARFEIGWSGPNNGGDWVTIVAAGAPPRAYGSYVDARTGRDDKTGRRVATLRAPGKPGRYELRYVQQSTVVIGTRAIEVTTVPNTLATTTPPISLPSTGPATSGRHGIGHRCDTGLFTGA